MSLSTVSCDSIGKTVSHGELWVQTPSTENYADILHVYYKHATFNHMLGTSLYSFTIYL